LVQSERALPLAPATDYTVHAVMGRCKQSLKDWQGAADSFAQVLAIKPDAKLSRLGYATALEKLGKQTEALQHYREFVTRFPSDDLTEKAKDGIARLNRAGIR
jgi:tetratricopeptide (TPR) repeat protein